jgi:NAD+ kinase
LNEGISVNRILILPNPLKKAAIELAGKLVPILETQGFELVVEKALAQQLGRPLLGKEEAEIWDRIDLVLVLGGDGSMLNAARRIYPRQIPLLGVNLGQLGFLTGVECHKIEAAFEAIRSGNYLFEERTMLLVEVKRNNTQLVEIVALNDLVVVANSMARMIRLETWIDGEFFTTYPADGLIVATATGSTAHSLSAGGPILDPRLEAFLITPICAHSLYARSVVLNKEAKLKIILHPNDAEVCLTVDGQTGITLQSGDEIHTSRAKYVTKLVRFNDQGLFDALKSRLKEGRI